MRPSRSVSWVSAALKAFAEFPVKAQLQIESALTVAAEGRKADIAKPLKGLGAGVFEIALRHHGDAYRVVYALNVGSAVWVVHAFQKKTKTGTKTPVQEIDLIRQRIKRLEDNLR